MFPNGGVPFGMGAGPGPGPGPSPAYDPHEARMDMRPMNGAARPQPRAPLLPRIQQEDGSTLMAHVRTSGELPVIQDLTPTVRDTTPQTDSQMQTLPSVPQPPQLPLQPPPHVPMDGYGANGMHGHPGMNGQMMMMNQPMDIDMGPPMSMGHQADNGGHRGGRGGRGRGSFSGDVQKFRPERRNDKTLVVEKIPDDKLSLEQVNDWFKRFGTVTNVAIDASNAKALVSFSNHNEAHAAWKSEDAVFNNRFVKLFWHRPMEGHGQVGARMLAASAPVIANIVTKEAVPQHSPAASTSVAPAASASTPARKAAPATATATALAAKQQLLEQQIAEQKSLMAELSTASSEKKKEIMARLRKLGDDMKTASLPAAAPTKTPAPPPDREAKERERLDKELEIHSTTVAIEEEESAEVLKAKLERLKVEVGCFKYLVSQFLNDFFGGRLQVWASKASPLCMLVDLPVLIEHADAVPGDTTEAEGL